MSTTASLPVTVERSEHGVVTVSLNRPQARNSLVWESWELLARCFDDLASDPDVRAVVLAGSGDFFCAGGDVKSRPAGGETSFAPAGRLSLAHSVLTRLRAFPRPLLAAVEGGAVGLGWSLALCADLVVAAEDAFFSGPFVQRGLVPDGGAAWLLTAAVGRLRAGEILWSGRRLGAEEATRLGLVNLICPRGEARHCAVERAAALGTQSARAVELTKRLLRRAESGSLEDFLDYEIAVAAFVQSQIDLDNKEKL